MRRLHTLVLFLAVHSAAASLTAQAPAAEPPSERPTDCPVATPADDPRAGAVASNKLRVGVGVFDALAGDDVAAAADVTYRLGAPWLWVVAPEVGAMLHTDGGAYGFGGLYLPVDLAPGMVLLASFGAGAYLAGDGLDLGHPVAFRSGIGLDVRIGDDAAASILFYHLSNGSLSEVNPGTEVLALGYSTRLGAPRRQVPPPPARPVPTLDPVEPGFWIVSAMALATAWRLDPELRRQAPGTGPIPLEGLANVGYTLGSRPVVGTAMVSTLALSHAAGWPMEGSRATRVFAGTVAGGVAVEAIKTMVGRGRPQHADDRYAFQPLTRDNAWLSFPSGHATAGFAVAAALDQEFDLGAWRWIGYGAAGMIAWSRVYQDAHWTSDTVAGAITGVAAARTVVGLLQRRSSDDRAAITLGFDQDAPLLLVNVPTRF